MPPDSSPPTMMEVPASARAAEPAPTSAPISTTQEVGEPRWPAMEAPLSYPRPRQRGFVLAPHDATGGAGGHEGELGCRDVEGFRAAALAAGNARAEAPSRLGLVAPDEATQAWLERWAEDDEQVRRCLTLRRADGAEITIVATIASFGGGVVTSLAVESIRPPVSGAILRSGVHSRAEVEAALALYDAADAHADPADVL